MLIPLMKISGKKIIWTIHNQRSHHQKNHKIKQWFIRILLRYTDFRITHAQEGIEYAKRTTNAKIADQVKYLPHPITKREQPIQQTCEYDIIIWGTVAQYKGIDLFLDHLWKTGMQNKYRILILGKIQNPAYEKLLTTYTNTKITLINKFADNAELADYISRSRLILFTYLNKFVLSSGALMDSLTYNKPVIGPDAGAFKDLSKYNLVKTYTTFDDLMLTLYECLNGTDEGRHDQLAHFMQENSWRKFGRRMFHWIKGHDFPLTDEDPILPEHEKEPTIKHGA